MSGFEAECTICLASMVRCEGQAIFTAECSHSFHFHCIASNVKHGNKTCPVCRAKWKEVPSLATTIIPPVPPPPQSSNFRLTAPSFAVMPTVPPVPPRPRCTYMYKDEPEVYNDDETLSNNDTRNAILQRLLMETHTAVPAVPRLTAVDEFTVLVHLKAPTCTTSNQYSRAPIDLIAVLDVSWSMEGTKLELLKRAMGFVIENLGPADRLSVIAFSDIAPRLFPLMKMSDTGKQQALQAVNSLVAGGLKNISEALRKSGCMMVHRHEENPVASRILLTDGEDVCHMRRFVPRYKNPIYAFGLGNEHDARLMHALSESSGGMYSFIENEREIQDAFAQCIGGLLSVVVKDLQVTIESANPNILLRSIKAGGYKSQLMPDNKSGCIDVGDLYADEERDFLVSVNIPKEKAFLNETSLLKVNCHYTDPLTKETISLVSENVTIKRPEYVRDENVVSIEVDRQRNRLQTAEAIEQAIKKVGEGGQRSRGVSVLENFRKVLSETVSVKSGDHFCTALAAELKEMEDRMTYWYTYETKGLAYILSRLISLNRQRATTSPCGGTFGANLGQAYQTPAMAMMVNRSQANPFLPGESSGQSPRLTGSSLNQYGMM